MKMKIEYLYRPGRNLSDEKLKALVAEIRGVAATCLKDVPDYQCLQGNRESLTDKVITLARDAEGRLRGFSSAVLIDMPGKGEVLHLGLTCVMTGYRSLGLTHRLSSKLVSRYVFTRRPVGRVWVTNVACVLSSLGNVASHFDQVFPAPFASRVPGEQHLEVANAIDLHHREKLYILPNAKFDTETFVFRGSVKDTAFQKSPFDTRYYHRDENLNVYYRRLMNFEEGDEVLQVGTVSLLTFARYAARRMGRTLRKAVRLAGRGEAA